MGKRFEHLLTKQRIEILDVLRNTKFDSFDDDLSYSQIIPYNTYSPWEDDIDFLNLIKKISNNSLVDIYRCYELWSLVNAIREIEGDIIEVGVWKGGTASVICRAALNHTNCKVYLADTFTGVPKATSHDPVYRGGEHSDTDEKSVTSFLKSIELDNFIILKGIFPDDFNNMELKKIKFCHIDVDTYLSAKDVFEYIWPRLSIGGVIIFDDYGFQTCEGITKYFNQLNHINGTKIYNLNGHGIFIKNQNN